MARVDLRNVAMAHWPHKQTKQANVVGHTHAGYMGSTTYSGTETAMHVHARVASWRVMIIYLVLFAPTRDPIVQHDGSCQRKLKSQLQNPWKADNHKVVVRRVVKDFGRCNRSLSDAASAW